MQWSGQPFIGEIDQNITVIRSDGNGMKYAKWHTIDIGLSGSGNRVIGGRSNRLPSIFFRFFWIFGHNHNEMNS